MAIASNRESVCLTQNPAYRPASFRSIAIRRTGIFIFLRMPFRLCAALLLCFLAAPRAQSDRFFKPTEGFTQAKDLPDDFSATVRSIQLNINDVFDGSTVHSEAEADAFRLGNGLHYESRPSTIRKRLLFKEGDSISKGLLQETENSLRSEEFLADAIIEVRRWEDGTAHLIVTTWDQWTTTMAFTPSFLGGNFYYLAGLVESNVLGTGQRIGFFYSHGRERDMGLMEYANKSLTAHRLQLSTQGGLYSDGYSAQMSLAKTLESRTDRWAFSVSGSSAEITEYVYFDANQLDRLPDSLAAKLQGRPNVIARFDVVPTHEAAASITRSFGYKTKLNVSASADWLETYNQGAITQARTVNAYVPPHPSALRPDERYDLLGGFTVALYQYDHKTVRNYRNLKWNETLQTGWRLSTKAAQNMEWLGADNHDFYFNHEAVFNNAWWDALFLVAKGSLHYYVSPGGDFGNGRSELSGEFQWKPVSMTSTLLSGRYGNRFANARSLQLVLGEDSGLNGYPNAYYAGQAITLFEAEQRFFPGIEFGTLVPAFALYGQAGNTFPAYDAVDLGDLHYSMGIGLRIGFSKTVQKLIYHLNLSQPIDEPRLDGPVFSFIVKQTL